MKCVVCSSVVDEAKHIAIDDNGDPQVICDKCHKTVRIFFEEVAYHGKRKSSGRYEGPEQGVQIVGVSGRP